MYIFCFQTNWCGLLLLIKSVKSIKKTKEIWGLWSIVFNYVMLSLANDIIPSLLVLKCNIPWTFFFFTTIEINRQNCVWVCSYARRKIIIFLLTAAKCENTYSNRYRNLSWISLASLCLSRAIVFKGFLSHGFRLNF